MKLIYYSCSLIGEGDLVFFKVRQRLGFTEEERAGRQYDVGGGQGLHTACIVPKFSFFFVVADNDMEGEKVPFDLTFVDLGKL